MWEYSKHVSPHTPSTSHLTPLAQSTCHIMPLARHAPSTEFRNSHAALHCKAAFLALWSNATLQGGVPYNVQWESLNAAYHPITQAITIPSSLQARNAKESAQTELKTIANARASKEAMNSELRCKKETQENKSSRSTDSHSITMFIQH